MLDGSYSIIGLGKLGACMAAAIASRGHNVIAVDINPKVVEDINKGRAPIEETNLDKFIKENRERLTATLDYDTAIKNSSVTFVIVPTPSCPDGSFSLEYAKEAFIKIGKSLKHKNEYHLVVLSSTVLPGSTRYGLLPILEKESGKTCGTDFGLCYSPEFIALGSVITDFLNPDFNLIGEYDSKSGEILEKCYQQIVCNEAVSKRMSIENAELTKVALNTFVTSKITFANMLAEACSHIPDGDIDIITNALGADKRIGSKYLKGGLGYGGTCFPRDNKAFAFISDFIGGISDTARVTDKTNNLLTVIVGDKISDVAKLGDTIGILGLSFKPHSPVIEESQAIKLAEYLYSKNFNLVGYDPMANSSAKKLLKDKMVIVNSAKECIALSNIIVIANADPEFLTLTKSDFSGKNLIVYDCWRFLREKLETLQNVTYIALGIENGSAFVKSKLKELWGNK